VPDLGELLLELLDRVFGLVVVPFELEVEVEEEAPPAPPAPEVPEAYEGTLVRTALVLAAVLLIVALPVVLSIGRDVPSGLAESISGIFK